ncbi:UBX domain-containing protein 11-like isoform X2 [Watersipora subatra]|uniref:UBX domain-containing protein 11-like isoform X2 n=1 Tax=Watersipora subatra TaxID=2589382 RepID=UPI00355AE5BA
MMSSPMSNLKKGKKVPLGSAAHNQNVPYRHADDALLEEVTSRMTTKNNLIAPSRQGLTRENACSTPTDLDLMHTMISRIAILEKQTQIQAKQLFDKDKRISVLEDKCRLYQKLNVEDANSSRYVRDLETRCLLYQQQISEMEEFLLDYGMMWVGEKDEEETSDESNTDTQTKVGEMWEPSASLADNDSLQQPPKSTNRYNIDFDKLIANIKELNMIAGDGETQIEKTKSGARFKIPDPVQLILYSNGMVMFDGPFRSYDEKTTQICIADLKDGFFPTELQSRYPEGVPFKVVDKRDVTFEPKQSVKAFAGQGQSLGGDTQPSRLVPSIVHKQTPVSTGRTESTLPGTKLTANQFLSHLPASVIRSGRVIDIRSSLSDSLKGPEQQACPVTIVQTETMQEIKERLELEESERPPSGRNITTLRIKDMDNHTYVLKMKFSDTIGDIISYLSSLSDNKDYQLVSTFPRKVYSDLSESLFNAGLTPNASLHLRAAGQS